MMDTLLKWMIWGYPGTPIFGNTHLYQEESSERNSTTSFQASQEPSKEKADDAHLTKTAGYTPLKFNMVHVKISPWNSGDEPNLVFHHHDFR